MNSWLHHRVLMTLQHLTCEAKKFVGRNLIRLRSYRYRLKGYAAIGDPLRVYDVPVSSIEFYVRPWTVDRLRDNVRTFNIEGGDWDRRREPLEDHPVYAMMRDHFVAGRRWEDTEHYRAVKERLERGGMTGNLDVAESEQTVSRYREYLSYVDDLFEAIETEGYRRQEELTPSDDFTGRCLPPSLNEVQVLLGRDGTVLHCYGIHRLSIAKILRIDTIPVRTRVRHEDWQAVRERLADTSAPRNPESGSDGLLSHPELQDVLE